MPERFREFGALWCELHPDWQMKLWDETTIPALVNQDLYDRAEEVAPAYVGQLRSDIARYEILYREGGVYLDVDFECLRPIDELLVDVECFVAWEIQEQYLNNAIIGSIPGHPFLKALIDGLPASVAANPGMGPWKVSGPRYMTATHQAYDGPEVTVFPRKWFYPVGCREIKNLGRTYLYADAYALHWWNNTHRKKGKTL
jgi:mannosyltransferase OCH1-like enzyme